MADSRTGQGSRGGEQGNRGAREACSDSQDCRFVSWGVRTVQSSIPKREQGEMVEVDRQNRTKRFRGNAGERSSRVVNKSLKLLILFVGCLSRWKVVDGGCGWDE